MYNSGKLENPDYHSITEMSDDAVLEYVKSYPDSYDDTNFKYRKNNNISSLLLNKAISDYSD